MHVFTHSLFSVRNIILIALAAFTARSFAVTIGQLDSFSNNGQSLTLQSAEMEQNRSSLGNGSLLQGWTRDLGIDANLIPQERSIAAEIVDEHGLFVLSYGPGVNAKTWLNYVAPEGMSFDMTMQNAANCLGLLVEFSQAPFEIQVSMESLGGLAETHAFRQEANYLGQQVEIPYQVFQNIDLQNVTSLQLEVLNIEGEGAPDIVISEFTVGADNNANVPEPTAMIFILLAASGSCLRRQR